jgi:hypothetical protein
LLLLRLPPPRLSQRRFRVHRLDSKEWLKGRFGRLIDPRASVDPEPWTGGRFWPVCDHQPSPVDDGDASKLARSA